MQEIYGNNIVLTRGDTFIAKVTMRNTDGSEYIPQEGDVVRFALKHAELMPDGSDFADSNPLVNITIPNDTQILEIQPVNTKTLAFGDYKYDIEITYADGVVDTFIADAGFTISPEVH